MTNSSGLGGAEILNLQPAFLFTKSWLFLGSSSSNNARESKHSSDDIVKQLESELKEKDAGVSRSSSSK